MKTNRAAVILRWGLAFVFFYAAIASLLDPAEWSSFLPTSLATSPYVHVLLTGFAVYQLILAALLFVGKKLYWASLFSTITLAAIVVVNVQAADVVFRDVGLALASLALFEMVKQKNGNEAF